MFYRKKKTLPSNGICGDIGLSLHRTGMEAEFSETDISKPGQIKPKLTGETPQQGREREREREYVWLN